MAEETITLKIIGFAIAGGILPPLLWLWFWLKEDAKRPEPTGLIILTFIIGLLGVIVTYPIQKVAFNYMTGNPLWSDSPLVPLWASTAPILVLILAGTEELIKYAGAHLLAFRSKFFDEPVDAMIYMITVALGFSAMENFFYLLNILSDSGIIEAVLSADLRFLGATLLHVISSAIIGAAIGYSYYKSRIKKILIISIGILTATLLHTTFNLLIIEATTAFEILKVFSYFWIIIIILILLFERIKRVKKPLN